VSSSPSLRSATADAPRLLLTKWLLLRIRNGKGQGNLGAGLQKACWEEYRVFLFGLSSAMTESLKSTGMGQGFGPNTDTEIVLNLSLPCLSCPFTTVREIQL